ncbi:MAG: hypothetical protein GY845_02075 [Planctomycetes bacterium]|nr:hypothetical protein [Planctomycetota bacterium]
MISKERLASFQESHFKNLLLHAHKNVPNYTKVFDEIGLVRDGNVDLSRFDRIPILTKEIIRKHEEELVSNDLATRKWDYVSSGGSTGEPIKFIQDNVYGRYPLGFIRYYYKNIIGIDEHSVRKAVLWGSERELIRRSVGFNVKVTNWLTKTIFLNSFKTTEDDMDRY